MQNKNEVKVWVEYFKDRGLSQEAIDQYSPYIKKLCEKDLPVIFEIEHLSSLLGIEGQLLRKMINSPVDFYREFSIPKRRGGKRLISSPYPSLLVCQQWIYQNILLKGDVHDCAHGFVPERSIFTNAKQHLHKKVLLKLDLKDFFPSVPINWVINYFSNLGYAHNVSFYLASLCCLDGALCQGSATSPYLSNLLLFSLDKRLSLLSSKYNLAYTRYADDLTFSGGYIPLTFIEVVDKIVVNYGLDVNKEKTRLQTGGGQRIVTGLSVAGDKVLLPRSTKRQLRKEFHFIRKYGYLSHVGKLKINYPSYLASLEGKFNFWLQAEPGNSFAQEAVSHLRALMGSLS